MKRKVAVNLFLLVLAGFLSGCYNSGESRERVLKIYNWADYIGEGVLEDFQAYYKEQTGERYPHRLSDIRHQRDHVDENRKGT